MITKSDNDLAPYKVVCFLESDEIKLFNAKQLHGCHDCAGNIYPLPSVRLVFSLLYFHKTNELR